jgi:hypothetical protein
MSPLHDVWQTVLSLFLQLAMPVSSQAVSAAVSAFGFFGGFLTYLLTSIAARKAYIRIQRSVVIVLAAQWVATFFGILDLVTQLAVLGWSNILFKLALIVWAVSLFPLYHLVDQVISIDRIKFKKPTKPRSARRLYLKHTSDWPLPFGQFQTTTGDKWSIKQFGVDSVDHYLKEASTEKQPLFFPILLVAGKHFRPWRICSRYAAAGLRADETVIYFGFNQPRDIIVDQLVRRYASLSGSGSDWRSWWKNNAAEIQKFKRLYIIDCYTSWIGNASSRVVNESPVKDILPLLRKFQCDPRDAIGLGSCYERVLSEVIHNRALSVRAVYDSISDFLQYGDPQLAMQLIKHNMVWEDQNSVSSLYLYIPNVPKSDSSSPVDINFLRWNAYCEINFEYDEKEEKEHLHVEGLFSERKGCEIVMEDGDYVLKDKQHKTPNHV